jgi:hypothetical protein
MCFIPLSHTWINVSLIVVILCEGITLLPLTSKGVYKDNYLYFNSFNNKGVFLALNKFDNISQKGVKESKRHFPNLIKALLHKGL